MTLGIVQHTQGNTLFLPKFPLDAGEKEGFVHLRCAVEAELPLENLNHDYCSVCDRHFLNGEEGGAVYLVEVGQFDDDMKFSPYRAGAVHWACAMEHWSQGLTINIEGPQWDSELLERLCDNP